MKQILLISLIILIIITPLASSWCILGIGDTCGTEESSFEQVIINTPKLELDNIKDISIISSKFGTTNITMIKDSIFTELKSNDALKKEAVFTMDSTKLSVNDTLSIVFNEVCGHINSYQILVPSVCWHDVISYDYINVSVCKNVTLDNKTLEVKEVCGFESQISKTFHTNTSYVCEVPATSLSGVKDYRIKPDVTMQTHKQNPNCPTNASLSMMIDWMPSLKIGNNTLIDSKWAWWNLSYTYRYPLNCSLVNDGLAIVINGSNGVTIDGYKQIIWTNCRQTGNLSLYYNNNASYIVANDSGIVPFEVSSGNGTSNNISGVWTDYRSVHHSDSKNATGDSSINGYTANSGGATFVSNGAIGGAYVSGTYVNPYTIPNSGIYGLSSATIFVIAMNSSKMDTNRAGILATHYSSDNSGNFFISFYQNKVDFVDFSTASNVKMIVDGTIGVGSDPCIINSSLNWHYIIASIGTITSPDNRNILGGMAEGGAGSYGYSYFDEIRVKTTNISDSEMNMSWQNYINTLGFGSIGNLEDSIAPVVIANSPANNNFTSNQTPTFNFTYTDETKTTGSCTLFINTTYAAGTNSSTLNNTATIITSNITLGIGLYNWTINCSDGTNTNISEVRNITISETPTINFFTNTTTEGNYYHLTQNWIYISVNTTNFESNTTINLYDNTGLYDTQTGLSNFSYNFTSLPNNNYIINATANNGTSQINTTTNKNYVIYSFITTINNPVLNENISRIININYTDTITPTGAATITSHNISIMNPNGSLNFTINSSTNNNQTYDFLNILTIINNYSVQIKTLDNNSNQKIFNRTFILTRNANLNITVKKYLDNSSINNFTINITDEITGVNEEYNTTNGIINISVINQRNYTITTFSQNYTINITHININKTYNDISIILLDYNSLYITFYYEINDSIFNESTVYYDIISDNYSHSYNTSNGILNINNIPPGNYTSRYYSAGYVERFFSFIMINYTGQIVNLYLQENLTSILITLRYNNYAAITGATIKAQKFIIATTDYLDIESGITNSEGQLIMSLTLNDEYYRFIVTLAGETILTTERSYIISNNINLFISIGSNAGDNYFDYKTIDYNMYYDYSTNQFWCIYNDVSSTTNEYCLRLLYTNGSTVYDCTTSSAGNLFINITPFNGSVYVGTCYVKIDGDWLSLISRTVSFDDIAGFAREGLFVQVIISIIFILVCLRWPEFIPVSFGLSLMLGRVIQINILSYEVLGGIIFTAIIISAWLGRQKNG